MRFYWVRYRIRQNRFHIFWGDLKENLAGSVIKNNPICHHTTMRSMYLKGKTDIEKSKDRLTGTGRG